MKVLEICPYEPPSSGWVSRVKLLRSVIEERGGICEILDIGPSRTVQRPGCICVFGGGDYLKKVWNFAGRHYVIHSHVNGRYFRGILLAIAGQLIGRTRGCRCVTTFHAGLDQPFIQGWRRYAMLPTYRSLFALSHAVICNNDPVADRIRLYVKRSKIIAIPAFSSQYMEFETVEFSESFGSFIELHDPLVSTYICYRPGFYMETLLDAIKVLHERNSRFGLVIVGTGDEQDKFLRRLERDGTASSVFMAGNLNHDEFLTLIAASDIHLRTPTSDGVSSTVLEALALGVPVLAADNRTRPDSVVLYSAADPKQLAERLCWLNEQKETVADSIPRGIVSDTAAVEVDLLAGATSR